MKDKYAYMRIRWITTSPVYNSYVFTPVSFTCLLYTCAEMTLSSVGKRIFWSKQAFASSGHRLISWQSYCLYSRHIRNVTVLIIRGRVLIWHWYSPSSAAWTKAMLRSKVELLLLMMNTRMLSGELDMTSRERNMEHIQYRKASSRGAYGHDPFWSVFEYNTIQYN